VSGLPTDQPPFPGPGPDMPTNDPAAPIVPSPVDPLARTLDALEASIEQPPQVGDWALQDPLAHTLGRLEQSVDGRLPDPPMGWEQFLNIFDRLGEGGPETSAAGGAPQAAERPSAVRQDGSPRSPAGLAPARPLSPASRAVDQREPFTPREHAQPTYHMMGGGTGVRGDGPETRGYCYLREEWVRADDCASCSAFEVEEEQSGDQEDRCRHMHAESEEEEKRDAEPGAQGDE